MPPTAAGACRGAAGGGRARRGRARAARGAARPLPARARGRRRRGPLVVRRARARPSSSTGGRCSTGRASWPHPHRVAAAYLELAVLVRALEGLSAAVGVRGEPRSGLALGRPVRPAREPARPRAGRPARARCIIPRGHGRRAHRRRVDQRRFRRAHGAASASRGRRSPPTSSSRFPGGKGANQAVAAARIGAKVQHDRRGRRRSRSPTRR